MGNQLGLIVKAINCDSCAKYVCNDVKCKSGCSGCCDLSIETEAIDLPQDSESEYSVEVDGCCHARQSG